MRIRKFSLIEVLVAVAIFAILIVLVMDIFGRATKTMSSNVQNVKVSASAKIAFDYFEEMLKNSTNDTLIGSGKFSASGTPIDISPNDGSFDGIEFRSIANINDSKNLNERRYGKFDFRVDKRTNDDYGSLLIFFDAGSQYDETYTTLLSDVVKFTITAFDEDMSTNNFAISTHATPNPVKYVKIDIEMFTPEDFQLWRTKSGSDKDFFYNNNVFVFSRIIKLP